MVETIQTKHTSISNLSHQVRAFVYYTVIRNSSTASFDADGIVDYTAFSTLTEPVYVNTWYDQSPSGYNFTGIPGYLYPNSFKPRLVFNLVGTKRIPGIVFNNSAIVSTATCTQLGLDNPNHATMITMKSSTVNTNVMFLTAGKKQDY